MGLFGSLLAHPHHAWSPDTQLLSVLRLSVSVLASGHLLSLSLEFSPLRPSWSWFSLFRLQPRASSQEGLQDGPAACVGVIQGLVLLSFLSLSLPPTEMSGVKVSSLPCLPETGTQFLPFALPSPGPQK